MVVRSIDLAWVTVADMQKAKDFFVKNLGLKVVSDSPEFGWAELAAESGARFGLGKENPQSPIKAGQNAVVCFNVDDIVATKKALEENNVTILGDIVEIPGNVKLLLIKDEDGNIYHLAQKLG